MQRIYSGKSNGSFRARGISQYVCPDSINSKPIATYKAAFSFGGGQPMSRILRTTQVATATYTTGQAAARIGISRQTLQAWIAAKKLTPPEPIKVGELTVRLWSHSDVEAARECVKENRPGPRRKASAEISEDL